MKKFLNALAVAGLTLALTGTPAHATTPTEPLDAQSLQKLEAIAGQPSEFLMGNTSTLEPKDGLVAHPLALDSAGCTLYPSVVHLRKSGGYGTVGAKPYTRCVAPVSRISQESTLYIIEWAGLVSKPMQTKNSTNTGQSSLTQQNVAWTCSNDHNSVFQQTTRGTITVGSKNYYTLVSTGKEKLPCGY